MHSSPGLIPFFTKNRTKSLMKKTPYLDFIKTLLPESEFLAFKETYQARIPKSIKLITTKKEKADLIDYFSSIGRSLSAPELTHQGEAYADVLYVHKDDKASLGSHFLHQWGFFYVQEVAAGLSAQILNPQKWDIMLDLCAAPWGKSVQLADSLLAQGAGFVLANEPSDPRRKPLIFNLNRCWLYNTAICAYRGEQVGSLISDFFDKVLVDAPCSWEGMNYKHDKNTTYRDVKWARSFAKMQVDILLSGLQALKVGGELVYSTCTLNPLENEQVIAQLLAQYPDAIELLDVPIDQKSHGLTHYADQQLLTAEQASKLARFWPHKQSTGGFFIAKIKKLKSIPVAIKSDQRKKQKTWLSFSIDLQNQVFDYLFEHWGIERSDRYCFLASESMIYLTSPEFSTLPDALFIEKIGVPIFKISPKGELIPQQGIATCLWSLARKNILEITDDQAQKLSQKADLEWFFTREGEFVILKWKWSGFALAKQVGGVLKNKMI